MAKRKDIKRIMIIEVLKIFFIFMDIAFCPVKDNTYY